jgi:hypothetical protein
MPPRTTSGLVRASAALALAAMTLAGCAGPNLPDYVEPKADLKTSATIDGYAGTYVTVIDNTKAPGAGIRMDNIGGNKVALSPGRHRLTVERTTSSRFMARTETYAFVVDFKAGHEYEVGPENRWNPFKNNIIISDKTAGGTFTPQ